VDVTLCRSFAGMASRWGTNRQCRVLHPRALDRTNCSGMKKNKYGNIETLFGCQFATPVELWNARALLHANLSEWIYGG
jgi:hypothetical protein